MIGFVLILICSYGATLIASVLPFPLPAPVIGFGLLYLLLQTKLVSLDRVEPASNRLVKYMSLLFVPATVLILEDLDILKPHILALVVIICVSTLIVMGISGIVALRSMRKESAND